MKPDSIINLTPGKRVLFLTKDPELIRKQLRGELDLQMSDVRVEDLLDDINTDALRNGNFEVIVSGYRKGVGSSRETATQCEVFSGIRIAVAASFAPIHAGNNVNQGMLMADHGMLIRLQRGEGV